MKKTDLRNDESVMNFDEHLLNVVNKHERPKLTVLDDHEGMMKGRQKYLNSLKEMGAMAVAKRSEAVGQRAIQTRWVDREEDRRVKSRLVLKGLQSMSGTHTARDVFTNTDDTVSENDAGCELTRQKQ